MSDERENQESTTAEVAEEASREARGIADLEAAVALEDDETLEKAYVFEPVERRDVSFTLALVTKRLADGRLEMVAVGGRVEGERIDARDFVRRARFPEAVLTQILAEFIDRCGVEGAMYREIPLTGRDSLADLLAPAGDGS